MQITFSKAPLLKPIVNIVLPPVQQVVSDGGIPIYFVHKPNCDVVRIEFVFLAGRPFEKKKLASTVCASVMREGAGPFSSGEIAEFVDLHGASLVIYATLDTITLQLACSKKHLPNFVELLSHIFNEAHFSEEELHHAIIRRVERLKIELAKNDVRAYRSITEAMFGKDHPYGYNSSEDLYRQLTRYHLVRHYDESIHDKCCSIFAGGDIDDHSLKVILKIASSIRRGSDTGRPFWNTHQNGERQKRLSGSDLQASIKIGRLTFSRAHPDFAGLYFLNTIFGGYFGSRLQSNLREDLGLTYGIHSSLDPQLYGGSLIISTEVANENVEVAIQEIYKEMDRLRNELISLNELEHVKNYMMGSFIRSFDGPFNSIRAIKSLILSGIQIDIFDSLINKTKSIDPEQVNHLAQTYLDRNDYWEVVVGSNR